MSKIISIAGIVLVAAAIAIGLLGIFRPGEMQVLGLTYEVAATLLAGGIVSVGLGALIGAVQDSLGTRDMSPPAERTNKMPSEETRTSLSNRDGFGPGPTAKDLSEPVPPVRELDRSLLADRKSADTVAEESKLAAERAMDETKERASETVAALEKAKEDIGKALNLTPKAAETPPPPPPPPAFPPEPEEVIVEETEVELAEGDEEQLFVVEERIIRGRPSRILSDGTVEAETDEGWMRFENLEHLEEYLDAMSPRKA
ncbi:hypothetical protein BH10PSE7_BH10PSE7_07220 [soil metagenome]